MKKYEKESVEDQVEEQLAEEDLEQVVGGIAPIMNRKRKGSDGD